MTSRKYDDSEHINKMLAGIFRHTKISNLAAQNTICNYSVIKIYKNEINIAV